MATIPTAYSRKFAGLYSNLGYPYTIDLVDNNIEENIKRTIQYIQEYKRLQYDVEKCKNKTEKLSRETYELLFEILK